MAELPQRCGNPDEVGTTRQRGRVDQGMGRSCHGSGKGQLPDTSLSPAQPTRVFDAVDTATTGDCRTAVEEDSCGGSGHEQVPDSLPSPLQPTQLFFASRDAAAANDGIETLDGGRGGMDPRSDNATSSSPVANAGGGGGVGCCKGDGNGTTLPRGSNTELDGLFDGLRITPDGDSAPPVVDGETHTAEQLDLHTRIEDLETYVRLETSKRLEAECRAQNLEAELQLLAHRCDMEIAARETAASAAKRHMELFAEARAAWRKTQGIVQHKERQLAAAEDELARGSGGGGDAGSLQRRLEDARKGQAALGLAQAGPRKSRLDLSRLSRRTSGGPGGRGRAACWG